MSRYEIANCMAAIAHGAAGIDATELKREALSFFGGRRMTPLSTRCSGKRWNSAWRPVGFTSTRTEPSTAAGILPELARPSGWRSKLEQAGDDHVLDAPSWVVDEALSAVCKMPINVIAG
ncbi:MAG: hypothetical protein R2845_10595 [Thermomicrobiales bacterium]